GLRELRMFIASFDRPNLSLAVLPGQKRWEQLRRIALRHMGACGIIYCGSRKSTEELAGKLRDVGVNAAHYHAGMEAADRSRTQDDFIQGKVHVVCATIAFGMGIDKGDVRYVVHYNMPGTLEGYYQEIGRAGRDGAPAETILFYSFRDVQTQLGFIEEIDNVVYRDVQRAKLQRMQEYAESPICRRRVLLSYFGEDLAEDCGNCDVCKDPPS
ncbi:MAG: RecQ family ATP-dependent DNA helicase, partial [Ottowia sp.]|nr:RecQ family ATP-dependent DNA helicase [Ottowia sp.]